MLTDVAGVLDKKGDLIAESDDGHEVMERLREVGDAGSVVREGPKV